MEMQRGYKFVPEKMLSGIKLIFLEFFSIPGGKYRTAMACSILEKKFLWRHISKIRKANNLRFCLFTSIIRTIISSKFKINPLTVTLFSGSGSAGEISKCRRLYYRVKIPADTQATVWNEGSDFWLIYSCWASSISSQHLIFITRLPLRLISGT